MNKTYDLKHAEEFWRIINPENGFVEIRLTPSKKNIHIPTYFNNLRWLKEKLKPYNTIINKKVCFFIKTFMELKTILEYNEGYFSKYSKICYGVNERFSDKNNMIDGSYNSLKNYRFLFFDVERADHKDINLLEFDKLFCLYVDWLEDNLSLDYGLKHPTLIRSGAGMHLLYRIDEKKITNSKKEWLKDFVKEVSVRYNKNKGLYEVDCLSDATRVLGLPGSMNVKRGRMVTVDTLSLHINNFKIRSKRQKKIKPQDVIIRTPKDILNEPLIKLLLYKELPSGGRNNNLIFQLKILLKNSGFKEGDDFVKALFSKINVVQREFFPSNFPNNNVVFSVRIVNNWCEKNGIKPIYK